MSEEDQSDLQKSTLKEGKYQGLLYLLDDEKNLAYIKGHYQIESKYLIPHAVKIQSKVYIVKGVLSRSFGRNQFLKKIIFSQKSQVEFIAAKAFYSNSLHPLVLPSSITKLEEGWHSNMRNITKIRVDPENKIYKSIDDSILLGKSTPEKEDYDIFILSCTNIENYTFPSSIEIIDENAFCFKLKSVTFPPDSKLRIIKNGAFSGTSIESITIPSNVTQICEKSFIFCKKLKIVEFQSNSNLEIIEKEAFKFCESLENITIPKSVKEICEGAFNSCKNLNKITFDQNSMLTKICDSAFMQTAIECITIPSSVKCINKSAFMLCSNLVKLDFQENSQLEEIEESSFYQTKIEKVVIPKSVRFIGAHSFDIETLSTLEFESNSLLEIIEKGAFKNTQIKEVTIPSKVREICDESFNKCINLKSIKFEEGSFLKKIGKKAFSGQVESIKIPSSVSSLDSEWMMEMKNLKTVIIEAENSFYKSFCDDKLIVRKSSFLNKDFDVLSFAAKDIVNVNFPSSVEVINKFAFQGCKNLVKIDFQSDSKIKSIEDSAFDGTKIERINLPASLSSLSSSWSFGMNCLSSIEISQENKTYISYDNKFVLTKSSNEKETFDFLVSSVRDKMPVCTIPNFIEIIGPSSFAGIKSIEKVEFTSDSNLRIIGEGAFCLTTIKSFSIPKSVTLISQEAFSYSNISTLSFPADSLLETIGQKAFMSTSIKSLTIPSNVSFIGEYSFANCMSLEKVEISKNNRVLKKLEKELFYDSGIKTLSISPHITTIGKSCFKNCQNLVSVDIPDDSELQVIEKDAFNNSKIERFTIPRHLTTICEYAFYQCSKLTRVDFAPDSELKTIKSFAFGSTKIQRFTFPSHITEIGEHSFSNISGLYQVDFCNDSEIQQISAHAFSSDKSLKIFTISPKLTRIGGYALSFCKNLTKFIVPSDTNLSYIDSNAFSDTNLTCFFVPKSVIEIKEDAFANCKNLCIIEFEDNSNMNNFSKKMFIGIKDVIVMIPNSLRNRFK